MHHLNQKGSILKSFRIAFIGMVNFFKEERNARIELIVGCCAIILSFIFRISKYEWIAVIFCCTIVLSLECINTAIENMIDQSHPEYDPIAKKVKDFSAGAVLMVSAGAAIVGIIIFFSYISDLFL